MWETLLKAVLTAGAVWCIAAPKLDALFPRNGGFKAFGGTVGQVHIN